MQDGSQATKFRAANWKVSLPMSWTVRTQVDSILPVLYYLTILRRNRVFSVSCHQRDTRYPYTA